jgi:hypothetical protein
MIRIQLTNHLEYKKTQRVLPRRRGLSAPDPPCCAERCQLGGGAACRGLQLTDCGPSCPVICGQPAAQVCNSMCKPGHFCAGGELWDEARVPWSPPPRRISDCHPSEEASENITQIPIIQNFYFDRICFQLPPHWGDNRLLPRRCPASVRPLRVALSIWRRLLLQGPRRCVGA